MIIWLVCQTAVATETTECFSMLFYKVLYKLFRVLENMVQHMQDFIKYTSKAGKRLREGL